MTQRAQARDIFVLIGLSLMWSSSFIFIKIAIETIPPVSISAGRILLAVVILGVVMVARKQKLPTDGRSWLFFLLIGCIGNGLPFFLISWGEIRIDSSVAAILIAASPLASFIVGHFVTTDERLNGPRSVGVLVGFIGIVVLIGPSALLALGADVISQLAVVGGAICYVSASFIARRMPPMGHTVKATGTLIMAAMVMVPLSLIIDRPWTLSPAPEALFAVGFLGLFSTALASLMLFYLIARVGATFLSLNNYINPVLGIIWGYLIAMEIPTTQTYIGLGLIMSGLLFTQLRGFGRKTA